MGLAIALAVVVLLLIGFLALTALEKKRGTRVLSPLRSSLDTVAERATSSMPGDPLALVSHALVKGVRHLVHEAVDITLFLIRLIERTLTRAARAIRESNAAHALGIRRAEKETTEVE